MEFLLKESFRDFDRFAERARTWQLDFVQLDRGKARFDVVQGGIGGVQLARARFSRRLHQCGAAPAGMRTFAIAAKPNFDHCWRGHEVTANHLLIFPGDGELDSVSSPGFDNIVFSAPLQSLERICQEEELPDLSRLLAARESVRLAPAMMADLRKQALACTGALATVRDATFFDDLREPIATDLARTFLLAIARSLDAVPAPLPAHYRGYCLRRAIAEIEDSGADGLTVSQLVQRTGCSERSLEYAFLERFGFGPKAYIQARRLNRARRDLSMAASSTIFVSDIANRQGFWHMGQFAADYRRLFDELPSETLKRTRADGAVQVHSSRR